MSPSPLPVEEIRRLSEAPAVLSEMRGLFEALDAEVASHRPLCWNRGACCRFGRYGHRLYVTTLELAYFVAGQGSGLRRPAGDHCPYHVDGFCTVRSIRPMGCRVFFCEPASQNWQPPVTENFLGRLRRLHDSVSADYVYVDWVAALERLTASDGVLDNPCGVA